INGSGFAPSSTQVQFTGSDCSPCIVTNDALTVTDTAIAGSATLSTAGAYTVSVVNGSGDASNEVTITVTAAGPAIPSIETVPSPPAAGQEFTFTISGSGFDPGNAQIEFTGSGCLPCTVTNSQLGSVTDTSIIGTFTLSGSGSYDVVVANSA